MLPPARVYAHCQPSCQSYGLGTARRHYDSPSTNSASRGNPGVAAYSAIARASVTAGITSVIRLHRPLKVIREAVSHANNSAARFTRCSASLGSVPIRIHAAPEHDDRICAV